MDMDDPDQRRRALNLLKPFPRLAVEVGFEENEFLDLRESIEAAEKGDATTFKAEVAELLQGLMSEGDGLAAIPETGRPAADEGT